MALKNFVQSFTACGMEIDPFHTTMVADLPDESYKHFVDAVKEVLNKYKPTFGCVFEGTNYVKVYDTGYFFYHFRYHIKVNEFSVVSFTNDGYISGLSKEEYARLVEPAIEGNITKTVTDLLQKKWRHENA